MSILAEGRLLGESRKGEERLEASVFIFIQLLERNISKSSILPPAHGNFLGELLVQLHKWVGQQALSFGATPPLPSNPSLRVQALAALCFNSSCCRCGA